jgi:glycosyltransferase involved in cell wall biosynthesis
MSNNNRFVFVAPMYNASETLPQMLHSICGQSYENWKLILVDDVSSNLHIEKCKNILKDFSTMLNGRYKEKIDVIWNDEKKWEVANVLLGISKCQDEDIVCRIDADDWLIDLDALAIINSAYEQLSCDALWTAHRWSFSDKNISGPLPPDADVYSYAWVSSHLKTFRKNLINEVKDDNFRGEDGKYIKRAGDQAIYLPILHNAKSKLFLPRAMYHYTIKDVPETYQSDDAAFQRDEAFFLRKRGYVK